MKKILLPLCCSLLMGNMVIAQGTLGHGNAQFNGGVGFSSWGVPVYVGLDYGTGQNFTIGAEASFRSYNDNWQNNSYRHTITGLSGNLNYHFNNVLEIPKPFDFYAGINIGFYIWTNPAGYGGSESSGLGLGGQVGGRYFFTDRFGLNLEAGGGNAFSGGKIGITVKF